MRDKNPTSDLTTEAQVLARHEKDANQGIKTSPETTNSIGTNSKNSAETEKHLPNNQNRLHKRLRKSKVRTNKLNDFKENANEQLKYGNQSALWKRN